MTIQEIKQLFADIKLVKEEIGIEDGFTALTVLKELGYQDAEWQEGLDFKDQSSTVKLALGQFPREGEV